MGPLDLPEEAEGMAFETLFFQELVAVNHALDLGYKLFYWRSSNNLEVDFVLYGDKGILAFEIKRTAKVRASMLSGLKAFLRDYPQAKAYFIYGGKRRLREKDIEIVPIEEALRKLPEILLLS
jgi:predicted AAA+ superfamily ATPase